jgi:environmental stress-induced protein Ves
MSWHMVRLADRKPQAWKNGGGLTRELLAWPSTADWRVRLSVADITADGPFSAFESVRRWFAVLEGDGVCLTVDGVATELLATSPVFDFAGAASTGCTLLGGPTRDFNLMLRSATGRLQRVQGQAHGRLEDFTTQGGIKFIASYAISTVAKASFGTDSCLLEPGTLAWRLVDTSTAGTDATWSVEADNALWMEITA